MVVGTMDAGMGGMGMGGMEGAADKMMMEQEGFIMSFFHKLPIWGQGILAAGLVIALAWIAGIIIGRLYASVKYPDPEKPALINPILKIGLSAAVVVCGFWIFFSFTKPSAPDMPVDNPSGIVDESMPEGEVPEGEAPEGEVPEGKASEGEASDGEASDGKSSEGENSSDAKESAANSSKEETKPEQSSSKAQA